MVTTFKPELSTGEGQSFTLTTGTFTTGRVSAEDQRIFFSQPSEDVYEVALSRLASGNAISFPARAVLELDD
jgi:hypothetical protein